MIKKSIETIYFNGVWKKNGEPDMYFFTDNVTGSTFTVLAGEDFISALENVRFKFGRAFPDTENMIYPR